MCGHEHIEEMKKEVWFLKLPTNLFRCNACSYTSTKFPEIDENDIQDYKEKIKSTITEKITEVEKDGEPVQEIH